MTRQEYLDQSWNNEKGCSNMSAFREYYAQYVNVTVWSLVFRAFGTYRLVASIDEHFNDISLFEWDTLARSLMSHVEKTKCLSDQFKANGDFITLAGIVFVLKEAARQIVEDYKNV